MSNFTAWMDDRHLITVHIDELVQLQIPEKTNPIIYWEKERAYFNTTYLKPIDSNIIQYTVKEDLPLGEELVMVWGDMEAPVYPRDIVRTEYFEEMYTDSEALLGSLCTIGGSRFAVWTPVATDVTLHLDGQVYQMERTKKGVWHTSVAGDFHECMYHFEATIRGKRTKVTDPYSKSVTAWGDASILIDFDRTFTLSDKHPNVDRPQDAIIYELHVRDATISRNSGVKNKGKYLGLTEKNTKTKRGYSTGLTYIKELGVSHVQVLPFNDFARVDETNPEPEYNWGYDPLHFQAPEGSYATDPYKGTTRINELKQMIEAFHNEGIGVIQDVVYNHVYIMKESHFEKLVPGYYFRYHMNGVLSDGTGVGNDFASERAMARKFILDSIAFWITEYRLDGLRFDLMGAIDLKTMQLIREYCDEIDRKIIIIGEGWNLQTALPWEQKTMPIHSKQIEGIGFFNNYFRDSVKGHLFELSDTGYVNGNGRYFERVPGLMSGVGFQGYNEGVYEYIDQSVNYVECHDNYTLWDRLALTNEDDSPIDRMKMHQLATGMTILSQGIPFIHAGQEFYRTKYGDENSYISGDGINQMNWDRRETSDENIRFVKDLIQLRKDNPLFRLQTKSEARKRLIPITQYRPIFGLNLLSSNKDIVIFVNPTKKEMKLTLPSTGRWIVSLTNYRAERITKSAIKAMEFTIKPYEFIVFEKPRGVAK